MEALTYSMKKWTTDELVGEVLRRAATDGPALRLVEDAIIRARLAAGDRLRAHSEFQRAQPLWPAGVRGTIEMGLAADGETDKGHETVAARAGAHTHDHSHGKKALVRLAAHDHHHVHSVDQEADAELNGHIHARAHAVLPWEQADPD